MVAIICSRKRKGTVGQRKKGRHIVGKIKTTERNRKRKRNDRQMREIKEKMKNRREC